MNSRKLTIIVFVILALSALAVWYFKSSGTLKRELQNFAISDTAALTKISIKNKADQQVTLERKGPGFWLVNGKHPARPDAINNLLEAIKKVQVRNPVGKNAKANIIKDLASGGTRVDIYKNNELIRVYYVGGETQDGEGTYMLMHDHKRGVNSSAPFVTHIPGFNGYLTPRYFTDEKLWRDKILFRYTPETLNKVEVIYSRYPDSSFAISLDGINTLRLFDARGNERAVFDTLKAKQYLSYYGGVNFEAYETLKPHRKDSILNNGPVHIIRVTDNLGNKTELATYAKPPVRKEDEIFYEKKELKEDTDRMYATLNGNKEEIILVQFYVIGKLLQGPSYFKINRKTVNK
jgi:hypothetical protein